MEIRDFLNKLSQILDESPTGILATSTIEGFPALRHMTAVIIPKRDGYLYAVTSLTFPKILQLESFTKVSWLFTSVRSKEILSIRGKMSLIDSPRFKAEVLEDLSPHLETFWKLADDPSSLVCLETRFLSGEYFNSQTGEKIIVDFQGGKS